LHLYRYQLGHRPKNSKLTFDLVYPVFWTAIKVRLTRHDPHKTPCRISLLQDDP
jgi:hypothetical protein